MQTSHPYPVEGPVAYNGAACPTSCAVSWSAIIAGGVVAAAVSLGLLLLGSSLGLATTSPFSHEGISATAFTASAAIWLIVMQWLSSAFGGYLTGRLRKRSHTAIHTDEVCFRDTAHGFLTWAIATLFTAAFLASAATSVLSGGAQIAGTVVAGAAAGAANGASEGGLDNPIDYYVDGLYRSEKPAATATDKDVRVETSRILMTSIKNGEISDADRTYLGQLVASRSNLTTVEATSRVNQSIAQLEQAKEKAKKAADTARKTASTVAIFTFLSMLIGAFVASVAAALGGRHRDTV